MRETVTEAEEPEPLLANQLYEAVQQVGEQRTQDALELSRQLTEAGVGSEATEPMRQASEGVRQLREQIDRAAQSVLGDETEALRRANEQLRQLADALNQEIDQAQGGSRQQNGVEPNGEGQRGQPGQNGEPREGDQRETGQGEGEPSEQSADDSQEDQQNGEGQPPGENGQPSSELQGQGSGRRPGQPNAQPGRGRGAEGEEPDSQNAPDDQPSDQGEPSEGAQQDEEQNSAQQSEQGQGGQDGDQQGGGRRGGARRREGDAAANSTSDENAAEDASPDDPNRNGGQRRGNPNGRGGIRGGANVFDNLEDIFAGGGPEWRGGPITGEDFRPWSEGMREVEDMLDDPELSAEVARIRDRAEQVRVEYKRHGTKPDWNKLVDMVAQPLNELQAEIAEEIRRKEAPEALAPIDRDAAPPEIAEEVRVYHQRVGSGR
jgi:hypothetical protein